MSEPQSSLPLFNGDIPSIEKKLWESADQLRANSNLSAAEYSVPVLGLIFLRYADRKFSAAQQELSNQARGRRRGIGKAAYQARGVMYLPEEARFSNLIKLPEGANIGMAVNDAMRAIEAENEELSTRDLGGGSTATPSLFFARTYPYATGDDKTPLLALPVASEA